MTITNTAGRSSTTETLSLEGPRPTFRVDHHERIDAPPATVWAIVADVARWPELVAHFQRVERIDNGALDIGASTSIKQTGLPSTVWTVTDLSVGESFTWTSRFRGLNWTGHHRVGRALDGRTTLDLSVSAQGWSAGLLRAVLGRPIQLALTREAAAIRHESEATRRSA